MSLSELYIKAFDWVSTYIGGVLDHFITTPVKLPIDNMFSFVFLGYTDLKTYLTFLVSAITFVIVHLMLYKGFKWLIKYFGGVVYRC